MRPNTGTRACTLRYSRSDASVSICIANTPGCTWRGSKPTGACSNSAVRLFLASTSTSRTFLPWSAARSAVAAVTVLLPTPPLPVKKSSRRSSSPLTRPHRAGAALPAEADALVAARPRRARCRRSGRPGCRPDGPWCRSATPPAVPSASALSMVPTTSSAVPSSSRLSSLGVWTTPMRSSMRPNLVAARCRPQSSNAGRATAGRPPGPLYARPQRGSDSPSNAGTAARAASHASIRRSSAS